MKTKTNQLETAPAAPEAPQKPSATAEEIARDVLVRAIARKFKDRREQQARILAMRRILAEHGIPDAEYYDGEDRRDGGRCPVCYRTGQRILDWGVCREHGMRWSLKTWHFQNCALVEPIQVPSQEVEKIESFHEIDPAHEPRPLGDHDHADPLVEEIEWELLEAVHANPPTDEMIAEEHKKLKWLAIRRVEALKIDPATAEVIWSFEQTLDPYGIEQDLPERYQQVGREYFARRSYGDIWVWFGDLPKATREALWGPQFKRWEEECLRRDGELPVLRF
jgi:hypothetical protein